MSTGGIIKMPKGNPNPQTVAQAKYQQKIGLIAKTYKLKKTLTEEFAEACQKAGVGQAAQLSKLMQEFIDSQK